MWDRIDSKWVLLENHTSVPEVLARGTQPATTYKVDQQGTECPPTRVYSGNLIQHIVLHGMWTGTLDSNVREHMLSTTLELGAVPNRNRSNNEQPRLDTAGPVLIFGEIRVGFRKLLDIAMCPISPILYTPADTLRHPLPPLSTMLGWGGLFSIDLF